MSASASRRSAKAGIRGLCPCFVLFAALVCSIGIAAAEPLVLEVARAEAGFDQRTGEPIISVTLRESSKRQMAEMTEKKVGRAMILRINGSVVMTPVIREPLLRGIFQISGGLSVKDTKDIAQRLSSGVTIEVELVSD